MTETTETVTKSARAPMREPSSKDRAAARAAELRDHGSLDQDDSDQFFIPPEDIPDGWTYEWKMFTTLGQQDPAVQVQQARAGWEPVPASRHPSYMPRGYVGETIMRQGQMLMERPTEIVEQARAREYRKARAQVHDKEVQLGATPDATFERRAVDGRDIVKKTYEHIPIPD